MRMIKCNLHLHNICYTIFVCCKHIQLILSLFQLCSVFFAFRLCQRVCVGGVWGERSGSIHIHIQYTNPKTESVDPFPDLYIHLLPDDGYDENVQAPLQIEISVSHCTWVKRWNWIALGAKSWSIKYVFWTIQHSKPYYGEWRMENEDDCERKMKMEEGEATSKRKTWNENVALWLGPIYMRYFFHWGTPPSIFVISWTLLTKICSIFHSNFSTHLKNFHIFSPFSYLITYFCILYKLLEHLVIHYFSLFFFFFSISQFEFYYTKVIAVEKHSFLSLLLSDQWVCDSDSQVEYWIYHIPYRVYRILRNISTIIIYCGFL